MNVPSYESLRDAAARHGQEHLFTFWKQLDEEQRGELLADVASIDFETVDRLIPTHVSMTDSGQAGSLSHLQGPLEPPDAYPATPGPSQKGLYDEAKALGRELITEGRVNSSSHPSSGSRSSSFLPRPSWPRASVTVARCPGTS
jgi:hypothetical protein